MAKRIGDPELASVSYRFQVWGCCGWPLVDTGGQDSEQLGWITDRSWISWDSGVPCRPATLYLSWQCPAPCSQQPCVGAATDFRPAGMCFCSTFVSSCKMSFVASAAVVPTERHEDTSLHGLNGLCKDMLVQFLYFLHESYEPWFQSLVECVIQLLKRSVDSILSEWEPLHLACKNSLWSSLCLPLSLILCYVTLVLWMTASMTLLSFFKICHLLRPLHVIFSELFSFCFIWSGATHSLALT